jgi:hypothetical protein
MIFNLYHITCVALFFVTGTPKVYNISNNKVKTKKRERKQSAGRIESVLSACHSHEVRTSLQPLCPTSRQKKRRDTPVTSHLTVPVPGKYLWNNWRVRIRVRMFTATFNNISTISWWSVLLVKGSGVHGENHRPAASHWQTLLHNVVSSTPLHERDSNSQLQWWYTLIV